MTSKKKGRFRKTTQMFEKWNMPFNMDKCAIMNMGKNKNSHCRFEYEIGNWIMRRTEDE